jgi:F-type H+-transporting ATPase subunit alpha
MTVAEQVISVFTGVKGFLDDVELTKIKKFENGIIEKLNQKNLKLLKRYKLQVS